MKNHWLWMVLGCGLPLLFIFFAPVLGIGEGIPLFVFIAAMLVFHLLMPMSHGEHGNENSNSKSNKNKEHH